MSDTNDKLLFVGGDIIGIQKFIYNISSKKAMVSLKGRSAYITDLTQQLCDSILNLPEIRRPELNEVVYCSGGKFYLIVEDNDEIRDAIDRLYIASEERIWIEHYGQLGISITYVPFQKKQHQGVVIDGVSYEQIGELWNRISISFSHMKKSKFKGILATHYNEFFKVAEVGGHTTVCAVSGIESTHCVQLDKDANGESIWVLPSVKKQIDLGIELRDKEKFKMLEEYADSSYLGILRMDVDNLGSRFIKGFANFAEYKDFSSRLSRFFSTTLKQIQDVYQAHLNIVYAGGDDLFAVGRWDKIIDFAAELRKTFINKFREEHLSISGGMAIIDAKFPIAKAAELAGNAENLAKNYNNGTKDAFSFFGDCVNWEQEFPKVQALKDTFVTQIEKQSVPKGLLHQLIRYADLALEGDSVSYKWHEIYYLTRSLERCDKKNAEARSFLSKLRNDTMTRSKNDYRLLRLSARWAELVIRFSKKQ